MNINAFSAGLKMNPGSINAAVYRPDETTHPCCKNYKQLTQDSNNKNNNNIAYSAVITAEPL